MIKYKICSFLLNLKIQTINLAIEWIKIGIINIIILDSSDDYDYYDDDTDEINNNTFFNSFYRG